MIYFALATDSGNVMSMFWNILPKKGNDTKWLEGIRGETLFSIK